MEQLCDTNLTFNESLDLSYSFISGAIIVIFVPLISIFGILSNYAFIFVVYRVKTMRNTINIFLVNLAVADSSLLVTAFSRYTSSFVNSPKYDILSSQSGAGCAIQSFLIYLCNYASLWTMILVSIERYLAVCHPLTYRYMHGKRRAILAVCVTWFISLVFAILTVPYTTVETLCLSSYSPDDDTINEQYSRCSRDCKTCNLAIYATDLLQFFIALLLNTVFFTLIIRGLLKSTGVNALSDKQSKTRVAHRMSVAKMIIVNGIVFFLCLTPFSIVNLTNIGLFSINDKDINVLAWIARVLFLLNSTLNPLIYNATNSKYRSAFKKTFRRKKNKAVRNTVDEDIQGQPGTRSSQLWLNTVVSKRLRVYTPHLEQVMTNQGIWSRSKLTSKSYCAYCTSWYTMKNTCRFSGFQQKVAQCISRQRFQLYA